MSVDMRHRLADKIRFETQNFVWNFANSFHKLVNAAPHSSPDGPESLTCSFQLEGGVGQTLRTGRSSNGVGTLG